jgi:hypothetical protein
MLEAVAVALSRRLMGIPAGMEAVEKVAAQVLHLQAERQTQVVVVVELGLAQECLAAQASSSFPMLAHNSLVAVSSLLLVATPFTHLQLLALLFQLHL